MLANKIKRHAQSERFRHQRKGNDLAILGSVIDDDRFQAAFNVGWYLVEEHGVVTLLPPNHFECARNSWAATWRDVHEVSVPDWFYNDEVLLTGTGNL